MLTTLLAHSHKEIKVKSIGAQPRIEVIDDDGDKNEEDVNCRASEENSLLHNEENSNEEVFKVHEKGFDWSGKESCVYEEVCTKHAHIPRIN